jgi:hypothetical protein
MMLSVYLMLLMVFTFKSLRRFGSFGPFVRALLQNFRDIFYFLILQLVLVIGFAYVF